MIATLTTFAADPWFDALAAIFVGYFVLCGYVTARMARTGATAPRYHHAPDVPEQQARAAIAKRNRDKAERRLRAVDDIDRGLERLLEEEGA